MLTFEECGLTRPRGWLLLLAAVPLAALVLLAIDLMLAW